MNAALTNCGGMGQLLLGRTHEQTQKRSAGTDAVDAQSNRVSISPEIKRPEIKRPEIQSPETKTLLPTDFTARAVVETAARTIVNPLAAQPICSPENALSELTDFVLTKEELGIGGRGTVSLWINAAGEERAIKIIKKDPSGKNAPIDPDFHSMEEGEINNLRIPGHLNTVKCHGLLLQKQKTDQYCIAKTEAEIPETIKPFYVRAILMRRVQGKDLAAAMKGCKVSASQGDTAVDTVGDIQASRSSAIKICLPIARALAHLHSNGFIYRDLKPENILLENPKDDQFDAIVLADMGFVSRCAKGEKISERCGTYRYMSPEVMNRQPYDQSADLWSLGVLILDTAMHFIPALVNAENKMTDPAKEMASNKMGRTQRFAGFDRTKKRSKILSYRNDVLASGDPLLMLALNLLEKDPSKRPAASEVVSRLERIKAGEQSDVLKLKNWAASVIGH